MNKIIKILNKIPFYRIWWIKIKLYIYILSKKKFKNNKLNLEEIEKKLDESLDKETKESLIKFLQKNRMK